MSTDRDRDLERIRAEQLEFARADKPFRGELTVIWKTEREELFRRIEDLEVKVAALLEAFRTKAAEVPMKEIPLSEHPLYKK